MSLFFTILGLILNTIASIIAINPLLKIKRNIEEEFVTLMDKKGNYTQKKHLYDQKIGIFCLCMFAIGFIFQIIGIIIGNDDIKKLLIQFSENINQFISK